MPTRGPTPEEQTAFLAELARQRTTGMQDPVANTFAQVGGAAALPGPGWLKALSFLESLAPPRTKSTKYDEGRMEAVVPRATKAARAAARQAAMQELASRKPGFEIAPPRKGEYPIPGNPTYRSKKFQALWEGKPAADVEYTMLPGKDPKFIDADVFIPNAETQVRGGPRMVREAERALAAQHPTADVIRGFRTTGMRQKLGGSREKQEATYNLSRQRPASDIDALRILSRSRAPLDRLINERAAGKAALKTAKPVPGSTPIGEEVRRLLHGLAAFSP